MKELLVRLKKADQATWDEIDTQTRHTPSICWSAIIQHEIQRAIEAKGWNWQLDKNSCIVLESHKTKTGEPYSELIAADHGKSPAAAILSAYLQALEANQ